MERPYCLVESSRCLFQSFSFLNINPKTYKVLFYEKYILSVYTSISLKLYGTHSSQSKVIWAHLDYLSAAPRAFSEMCSEYSRLLQG